MAENRRLVKFAGLLKKEVSYIINQKLKNPEKGFITINTVKVSPDMKIASFYFTVLGEDEQKIISLEVLKKSSGFIRSELRNLIKARYLPELRFFYDDTFEQAQKINSLISKIHESADSKK